MHNDDRADGAPTIGILGIGRMGSPIATALAQRFPTHAFDVDPGCADAVPHAIWEASAEELARSSDVLITVLPGATELRQCMPGLLSVLRPGSLWLDLTSGDPAATRELAGQATLRDVDVVSAPMGGSVAEASDAELIFFVGGDDAAVERVLPVLRELSRRDGIRRAGARPEDGQIVKLLANGLWFANAVAAAEAMLVGQGLGLAPADLHRLLKDSAGGSRFVDEHLVRLLDGDYLTTFGIDRVVEELDTIGAMSADAGVSTPLLDASARLHRLALDRFGPELGELLAVRVLEEQAGRRLRR